MLTTAAQQLAVVPAAARKRQEHSEAGPGCSSSSSKLAARSEAAQTAAKAVVSILSMTRRDRLLGLCLAVLWRETLRLHVSAESRMADRCDRMDRKALRFVSKDHFSTLYHREFASPVGGKRLRKREKRTGTGVRAT